MDPDRTVTGQGPLPPAQLRTIHVSAILGEHNDPDDDPEVIRAGGLARLRDPAPSHIAGQADLLATSARRALAAAVLAEAAGIARDPDATLIERTVARLAAHRIRADLDPLAELTRVQCLLIRGLEQLGDPEAAYQVAAAALAELPRDPQTACARSFKMRMLASLPVRMCGREEAPPAGCWRGRGVRGGVVVVSLT